MSETFNADYASDPTSSPGLTEKFASVDVINPQEKYEALIKWGIDEKFAHELNNNIFIPLGVTVAEMVEQKPNIEAANQRLEPKLVTLNAKEAQKVLFSTTQASNDDIELSYAA